MSYSNYGNTSWNALLRHHGWRSASRLCLPRPVTQLPRSATTIAQTLSVSFCQPFGPPVPVLAVIPPTRPDFPFSLENGGGREEWISLARQNCLSASSQRQKAHFSLSYTEFLFQLLTCIFLQYDLMSYLIIVLYISLVFWGQRDIVRAPCTSWYKYGLLVMSARNFGFFFCFSQSNNTQHDAKPDSVPHFAAMADFNLERLQWSFENAGHHRASHML